MIIRTIVRGHLPITDLMAPMVLTVLAMDTDRVVDTVLAVDTDRVADTDHADRMELRIMKHALELSFS